MDEIEKRRTFGIISHPDAGKTTLTEKLLLFGGAIQLAGTVKGRSDAMRTFDEYRERLQRIATGGQTGGRKSPRTAKPRDRKTNKIGRAHV